MPDLNMARKCQGGKPKGLERHHRLEKDDRFPFIPAFYKHAGWQCQKQSWQRGGKANQSEIEGATGDPVSQIGLGCVLHPCADD